MIASGGKAAFRSHVSGKLDWRQVRNLSERQMGALKVHPVHSEAGTQAGFIRLPKRQLSEHFLGDAPSRQTRHSSSFQEDFARREAQS